MGSADIRDRRALRDEAGDAFAAAFEMVATPVIFGLLGWFIDGRVGSFPIFTLVLAFVVLGYQVWRFTQTYNKKLDQALELRRAAGDGVAEDA